MSAPMSSPAPAELADEAAHATRLEMVHHLEREVGVLMRRSRRVLSHQASRVHPDLTGHTYLMLGFIKNEGPVRAAEIVEVFGVDKGAVSRGVQTLLDAGLIERAVDPDDRRAVLLSVTDEARERVSRIALERMHIVEETMGEWSTGELEEFVASFSRYNERLESYWSNRL